MSIAETIMGPVGTRIRLTVDQSRMLMNYLDRVYDTEGGRAALAASLDADGDRSGELDDLLRAITTACSVTYQAHLQAGKDGPRHTSPRPSERVTSRKDGHA